MSAAVASAANAAPSSSCKCMDKFLATDAGLPIFSKISSTSRLVETRFEHNLSPSLAILVLLPIQLNVTYADANWDNATFQADMSLSSHTQPISPALPSMLRQGRLLRGPTH
ncbi:uncharacterized protein A1O5_09666 [Cladophialophora psammophila CBS 110553]|uniref:Uncharacterized protein n=1 Tax=Cladophialophora psammophila CBS 110553 TaxID=1182543 RepID=W9WPU8_9EURO|nr:uncharacterized protein A1O5_09666 [Cladophialophora psammophila CBS 110553]EXJ67020.1 hypothetical protein A1O5_09666 [Cladophialophora psammophila CBS 110553]